MYSIIRDRKTARADFIFYSNRIIRLLVEEGLNHLPTVEHEVTTPVGRKYDGLAFQGKICGVSIMRAGEAMEQGLRDCCRSVRIGKILIQRDEETTLPRLFYDKLPEDIANRWVLLLDPMFATGGSAIMAVQVLLDRSVPEERILFLNLIASPSGIVKFQTKFPAIKIVTAFVDQVSPHSCHTVTINFNRSKLIPLTKPFLSSRASMKRSKSIEHWPLLESLALLVVFTNSLSRRRRRYIVPGLGDFGDRYYTV